MKFMSIGVNYRGTRWYKCDLHLHTTASLCFHDNSVTAEEWVKRAIEQGLDCVAITDHNTGIGVDEIKKAAEGTGLVVFPGVEITCDSSKIHLLILFDLKKTSADIRDFLVRANIQAADFGKKETATIESVFEVASLAQKAGAIVIPAHIDEYNGLGSISSANLDKLFSQDNINAVQVVHEDFLNQSIQIANNTNLKTKFNVQYNNPNPTIDDLTLKEWYTPVKYAKEKKLSILTFSDNPHEAQDPKHGLWGIGNHFTWIKMDEKPSLEGLRQAFLLPEYRIKNMFDNLEIPYTKPELWIKSISIRETTITDETMPLKIEFSPQLNTLIGGRGSGKSSILRFIRGVFNRTIDLTELSEILKDHNDFYKREDGKTKKGVLKENSIIEIEFIRDEILHKITASEIQNSKLQKIQIERLNEIGDWEQINDEGYIDFFNFEHYSQKQIYEIAQEPNALRERIDRAITGLDKLKEERVQNKTLFLEKSAVIRTIDEVLAGKGKIETKIKDIEEKIKKLQQSGIADIISLKEKFAKENSVVEKFSSELVKKESKLEEIIKEFEVYNPDFSTFGEDHTKELIQFTNVAKDGIAQIRDDLINLKDKTNKIRLQFEESVNTSNWEIELNRNDSEFTLKKDNLEKLGIGAISNFERFSVEKTKLEKELDEINTQALTRETEKTERDRISSEFFSLCKEITSKRQGFVKNIMTDDKIKVSIKPFRNKTDFESRLRKILQRENSTFQQDIDTLSKLCFIGNVENGIEKVRDLFLKIRADEEISINISRQFITLVKLMNDSQIDEIKLLIPEDEIDVQYKTTARSNYKSLSTASAGQKTTAILTFILSFGRAPLILDQPEDDLDNRLVYDLIVDRLKKSKENRQIIVVTHNANIPVNGDAEYIISMDSESKKLKVLHSGTVEQDSIKKEICDVMEGGDKAFEMRSKRYNII